jgi:hypothetical protein
MVVRFSCRGLSMASLALALIGCGGGGGSGSDETGGGGTPPTISAAADSASTIWGQTVTISPLTNDRVSDGTNLSLGAVLQQPSHGSVEARGGDLIYSPSKGFFGTDTLTYEVQSASGLKASASVSVQVAAQFSLSGWVGDGPVPQSEVTVIAGAKQFKASTDALGQYRVDLALQDPDVMVRIEALGLNGQTPVRLSSLLGTASALAAASGDAQLSESVWPAARLTHLSTAMDVLAVETLGRVPQTMADLDSALSSISFSKALQWAAVVKLVVDGAQALPPNVADTRALIQQASTREAFLRANLAGVADMTHTFKSDATLGLATPPVVGPESSPATLLYFFGEGAAGSGVTKVTYRTDGTASVQVTGIDQTHAAKWQITAGEIKLTFDQFPVSRVDTTDFSVWPPLQSTTETRYHSLFIRPLGLSRMNGMAQLCWETETLKDSQVTVPRGRCVKPELVQQRLRNNALPFSSQEFKPGSIWAGLGFNPQFVTDGGYRISGYDMVSFSADGKASQMLATRDLSWELSGGQLVLRSAGDTLRYERLLQTGDGEERWLVEMTLGGALAPTKIYEVLAVPKDPVFSFDVNTLAGVWKSRTNMAYPDRFYVSLEADGRYTETSVIVERVDDSFPPPGAALPYFSTRLGAGWSMVSGEMRAQRYLSNPRLVRYWTPIRRAGDKLMVMEWRPTGATDVQVPTSEDNLTYFRVNIYDKVGVIY